MPFILSLLLACGISLIGLMLFRRTPPNPYLDSLRLGKSHYLLLGILLGIFFPETETVFRPFEMVRHNLMGIILLWLGLQTGLATDLQPLRNLQFSALASQATIILPTGIFTVLAVLASGPVLYNHLGLIDNLPLAIVLLTGFAITTRAPEPIARWTDRTLPAHLQVQNRPIDNIASLGLLTLAFPFVAKDSVFYFSDLPFVGPLGYILLTIGLSVAGGIALDFIFRSQADELRSPSLIFGIVITLFGLSQMPGLPALSIGFLAGIWLINTTVAKREVVESLGRASDTIKPIFYTLLGTIIGGFSGASFFLFAPLLPLAVVLILVRGMGRTIGLTISQTIWQIPETWRELIGQSWHPQGTLAIAIGVQAMYLLQFEHHTLIAGITLAVLLGQVIIVPPHPFPQPNRD